MIALLLKSMAIWLVIVGAAIMNGLVREKILVNVLGAEQALPVSGFILALLVFFITSLSIPIIDSTAAKTYLFIGFLWVVLTLGFELLFGHFILGKTLYEIGDVFNIARGNLFTLVLLAVAFSPWLAAKAKGKINKIH